MVGGWAQQPVVKSSRWPILWALRLKLGYPVRGIFRQAEDGVVLAENVLNLKGSELTSICYRQNDLWPLPGALLAQTH